MKDDPSRDPRHTVSYRLMALLSKVQFRYIHQVSQRRAMVTAVYLICAGVTALSTITIIAYLDKIYLASLLHVF
jgi:hypothetical protein